MIVQDELDENCFSNVYSMGKCLIFTPFIVVSVKYDHNITCQLFSNSLEYIMQLTKATSMPRF